MYIGQTLAFFQLSTNIPVKSDWLKCKLVKELLYLQRSLTFLPETYLDQYFLTLLGVLKYLVHFQLRFVQREKGTLESIFLR